MPSTDLSVEKQNRSTPSILTWDTDGSGIHLHMTTATMSMTKEMYYGRKYKTKEVLIKAIEDYIDYCINKRVQRNLGVVTPMEFYKEKLQEAT